MWSLHGLSLVSGPVGSSSLLLTGSGQGTDTRNALENSTFKGHLVWQHGPELASSKELLRPSYTYQELCPYLPCPGIECSKVQVSTPMCSDQLSFTHMEERKYTWNLPFRRCGCKVGYRWLLRWWELTRDHHCGWQMIYGSRRAHRSILPYDHTRWPKRKICCSYRCGEGTGMFPRDVHLALGSRVLAKELGPDNDESPHKLACPLNVAHPATANNVRSTVGLEFLSKLPPSIPTDRCVATELRLLITAFEIENMDLGVLVSVLLAGVIPDNFPIEIWHGVVWITLASSASYILRDEAEWNIAYTLLADVRITSVVVTNCQGDTVYERQTEVLNRKIIYPLKVVLSDPKRTNWPSRKCTLDATGLGGSDLPSQVKADITVRTDKHKQNIYGPSMTTVETVAKCHIWGRTVSTALGISKAAHEFLVLHYFATDSIVHWNSFIHEVMPLVPLPAPAVRRAEVVELLRRIHIAPSHRRMPHHTWKDALSLVMDLLLGFGKRRYFNMARVWQRATRVNIKGFSAGSYVGLALVHVLRDIKSVRTCSVLGAIACPPFFLKVPDDRHTVHLIHYVPDKLCRWNPGQPFLDTLRCKYTLCMGTLTYTNIILERTSIIILIGWACNWKEEFSLCPISWWGTMMQRCRSEGMQPRYDSSHG